MIRSPRNQKLKDMRRLRRCKDDRALLEGPHLVGEAVAAGIELLGTLATPEFLATPEGAALAASLPRPPLQVAAAALAGVADADSPRGVVAAARLPRGGVEQLAPAAGSVVVYLEGLQDPGNLGAIARSAEAAGAAGLALAPGSVHPNHPRALRASAGSLLRLPVAVEVDPARLESHLEPLRPRWVALSPRGGRAPEELDLGGTLLLAVGAEGPGLSAALRERADALLTLSLEGRVESLNAAVATALVLFELRRLRRGPRG